VRRRIPNALTIGRIFLIPVYVWLITTCDGGRSSPAAIVFGVAGVTDQIDGYLERLWHVDRLPFVALLIPARDVVLMLATPLVVGRGYRFEVNMLGKIATWVLYASIALTMLTPPSADWPLVLFWIGFGIAVLSAVGYARKARVELAS
jgi:CDP-diacylglycerol--glycerol-3-phosphate 3-phosphatidyltransferase